MPESYKTKFYEFGNDRIETYSLQLIISESQGMMKWPSNYDFREMFLGGIDGLVKPGTIDVNKALLIADIGIGMDSPFALDYRNDINNPCVIFITLGRKGDKDNRWMKIADNFDEFIDIINKKEQAHKI